MFTLCVLIVTITTTLAPFILPPAVNFFGYKLRPAAPALPIVAALLFLISFYLPDIHISSQTVTFQQHFVGGGMFSALLYLYAKQQLGWKIHWFIELVLLFAWVSVLGVANELLEFGLSQSGLIAIDTTDTSWDLFANTLGAFAIYGVVTTFTFFCARPKRKGSA
jgi:hypothetical protein